MSSKPQLESNSSGEFNLPDVLEPEVGRQCHYGSIFSGEFFQVSNGILVYTMNGDQTFAVHVLGWRTVGRITEVVE